MYSNFKYLSIDVSAPGTRGWLGFAMQLARICIIFLAQVQCSILGMHTCTNTCIFLGANTIFQLPCILACKFSITCFTMLIDVHNTIMKIDIFLSSHTILSSLKIDIHFNQCNRICLHNTAKTINILCT